MSIGASLLRGVYRLSGVKKAFALPEEQLLKAIEKANRGRGFFMPTDHKAHYEKRMVNGFPCLIVRAESKPSQRSILFFFGGGMALLLLFQRGLLPPPTPGLAAALPWLVGIYQEYSRDPVVLRFADMILAVVCAVLALYFAASFAFRHPRPRLCLFFSLMGIVLNLEALANGQSLFFTALTAAAVLVLLAQSWALLRTCFGPAWPECLLEDRMPSGALERAEGDNAPGGAGVENHHREDD